MLSFVKTARLQEFTCQIGADVIDDDQRARQQEPDDAIEDVGDEEGRRHEDEEQDEVDPCILAELNQ